MLVSYSCAHFGLVVTEVVSIAIGTVVDISFHLLLLLQLSILILLFPATVAAAEENCAQAIVSLL